MSTEDRRVVGFKVTIYEFNILQSYANEMYNFQVQDPQTNSVRRMIEEPRVGLLIRGFICIYQTIQLRHDICTDRKITSRGFMQLWSF